MKDRITNQLDMVGACINIAELPTHALVWTNQPPLDFGTDFAVVKTEYGAITAAAAIAYAATTGPADGKGLAETALENAAFTLARACASHFKKTGDHTRLAQVNLTKSAIVRLRDQILVTTATLIRDIGNVARTETDAANRGVTAARVTALTGAVTAFAAQLNAPRGQIANRSVLIRVVETRVAGLVTLVEDLDDLALQFDATAAGLAFIAAWKQARIIVDSGGGHTPPTPPTPTPPPA